MTLDNVASRAYTGSLSVSLSADVPGFPNNNTGTARRTKHVLSPVCGRKENSARNQNRIAIIWPEPEPDQHPIKLAGFGRILNRI